jgi:hypothetical protein
MLPKNLKRKSNIFGTEPNFCFENTVITLFLTFLESILSLRYVCLVEISKKIHNSESKEIPLSERPFFWFSGTKTSRPKKCLELKEKSYFKNVLWYYLYVFPNLLETLHSIYMCRLIFEIQGFARGILFLGDSQYICTVWPCRFMYLRMVQEEVLGDDLRVGWYTKLKVKVKAFLSPWSNNTKQCY